MTIKPIDMVILDAYQRYGQKLYIVLSTAIKITKMNRLKGTNTLGDFEYRSLVEELEKANFSYNPSMMLRALEKEYGIIETTYKSGNQRWYRFKDLEEIERALNSVAGIVADVDEPEVVMLKIQMKSLQLGYWLKKLKHMSIKQNISTTDVEMFRRFAFDVLPKLVHILKKAEEYEDQLYVEINMLKEILGLATIVADRVDLSKTINDTGVGIKLRTEYADITEYSHT
ncbi:MAG: hypothetical protein QXK54_03425 [Ignisphaera sp.]